MTDTNREPEAGLPEADESARDPWLGRVLGDRYRVLERLAEGGMGVVYVAEHLGLHKEVALKLVHEDQVENADHARRFVREAMVTSRIDHPNVISALDFGSFDDGTAYLAMALVRGPTLSSVLEAEGCLAWARAAEIGAQVADALSAARAHGIVHRDLKPDNVILQRLENGAELVKVLDFGIAKYARDSLAPPPIHGTQAVTRIGVVIGTPGYMSPEQSVGKRADHRSDLYGLGVLLWEAVVGRRLWDFTDVQQLMAAQLNEPPPSVREASGDLTIPDEFDELVARLLAIAVENRPGSAIEVRDELRALVAGVKRGAYASPARVRPVSPPPPMLVAPPPIGRIATPTRVDRPQKRAAKEAQLASPLPETHELEFDALSEPPSTEPPPSLPARPSYAARAARSRARIALASLTLTLTLVAWFVGTAIVRKFTPGSAAHSRAEPSAVANAAVASSSTNPGLGDDLRSMLRNLVEGGTRDERVTAAQALLRYVPVDGVPSYARQMARLQLAETCPEKKAVLDEISELDDPRTLPVLAALSQRKRGGCGLRGHYDCLACLRDDLSGLIHKLEAKQLDSARPAP